MSQLRKAVEKAKEARSVLFAAPMETLRTQQPERVTTYEDFCYTRTTVVDVCEKLMLDNRIVAVAEKDPACEQFRFLRTQIFKHTRQRGLNTIQVTGFGEGDGASLVALNLAISIARDTRQTTLLADLNFRTPAIAGLLGLAPDTPGLRSYFQHDVALEDLFISPGIRKLTVLPAGGSIENATELLGSSKVEKLVREWKRRYDDRYVILDTPGIGMCPDPLIISEYVDGIVLVARANHTSQESIKAAMELIPKEKLLGVVMNDMAREDIAERN